MGVAKALFLIKFPWSWATMLSPLQQLLFLTLKPFMLSRRYLGRRKYMYRSGKMFWVTLIQGHDYGCGNWILGQLCDLALWPHPWPWPWIFKVKIWNCPISGMRGLIDMKQKGGMWISHSWPWLWPLGDHGEMSECIWQWPGWQINP